MYELGFVMGVAATAGALFVYRYRARIWAWIKYRITGAK
jgi:hypothetical protein